MPTSTGQPAAEPGKGTRGLAGSSSWSSGRADQAWSAGRRATVNQRCPDHSTIAEFRRRHEADIKLLFDDVLGLSGGGVGVCWGDHDRWDEDQGERFDGSEPRLQRPVNEILREAEETDRREDDSTARRVAMSCLSSCAQRRGASGRWLRRNGGWLSARAARSLLRTRLLRVVLEPEVVLEGKRRGGRREWPRVARRQLEAQRAQQARPIPRDREDRMFQALGRFEETHRVELAANEAYDHWRATARDRTGRVMRGNHKPYKPAELPEGVINISDPDSRVMRTQGTPPRQAYNAQAAVNDKQIVLAAEVSISAPDFGHLKPMLDTTLKQLHEQGVTETTEVVLADAGYWHTAQMQAIEARGIEVLAPPDGNMREGTRPGWDSAVFQQMRDKLTTDRGRELYAQRKVTIEPVFGQIKYNRHIDRFMRRGRSAAQSEWRLITATHNLLKLHSHWIANPA